MLARAGNITFIDDQFKIFACQSGRHPLRDRAQGPVLACVDFADSDAPYHASRIAMPQAFEKPGKLSFDGFGDRHTRSGADQHRCEVFCTRACEGSDDVLGDESLRIRPKIVEIAQPCQKHEISE